MKPDTPSLLPVITSAEAEPVRATAVNPVGNYAYAFHFSDGHTGGIFELSLLRELGEGAAE